MILMIEGSGSGTGSVPMTYGSGSGRLINIRILRSRIHNTALNTEFCVEVLASRGLPPEIPGEGIPEGDQGLPRPNQVLRLRHQEYDDVNKSNFSTVRLIDFNCFYFRADWEDIFIVYRYSFIVVMYRKQNLN
jgi:hypothetical protein